MLYTKETVSGFVKRNAHLSYDHFHLPQKNSVELCCEHIYGLPNDMLHLRETHLPSIQRNMDGWQTTEINPVSKNGGRCPWTDS